MQHCLLRIIYFMTIYRSYGDGPGGTGVVIDGNGSTIRNNQFIRNRCGIALLTESANPIVSGNTFTDNDDGCCDFCQSLSSRPEAITDWVTDITPTSAKLNGRLNPNWARTIWYYQYGTSTSYESETSITAVGSEPGTVSVSITLHGLSPNASYHYRLAAVNSIGTSYGDDKTFSTTIIYVESTGSCGGNTPCYTAIQSAIDATSSGSVIKIMAGTYAENLDLNSSNNYTLQGGWDSTFTSQTSTSSVSSMTIGSNSGIVTVEYMDIQ